MSLATPKTLQQAPATAAAGAGRFVQLLLKLLLLCICCRLYAAADTVQVRIEGITEPLLKNVLAYLSIEQQKNHPRLTAERIQRLHQRAPEEIGRALQPFGYYRPQVSAELKPPDPGGTAWQAYYRIEKGPPLPVKSVDVRLEGESQKDPVLQALLANFPVKAGDTLNHAYYEQGKQALQDLAKDRGYLEASFTKSQLLIDEQAYTAEVTLHFKTGLRYRFGPVTFKQDAFDEDFLRHFLTFKSGDFYTLKALSDFRYALTRSRYFEDVTVETQADRNSKTLPVEVILVPKKLNQYRSRIGYGADTGIRAGVDWERRYLNAYGHRFDMGLTAKQYQRRLEATVNYFIPLGELEEDYLTLTLGYEGKDLDINDLNANVPQVQSVVSGTTRANQGAFIISKYHSRKLFGDIPLREALSLEYFIESYNLFDILPEGFETRFAQIAPQLVPVYKANYQLLIPAINWSYQQADNPAYITHGQQLQLSLRGSKDGLGSNASFWQTRLDGKVIRSLWEQGRVIIRGNLGYTWDNVISFGGFEANLLPESILFKTGGANSVRGYSFEGLNYNGLGARNLLVGSVEYEHRILAQWGLAAFYDAGNVFNDFSHITLARGAGAGVRWYSPVGPIKLDAASALSKDGNPWRLDFNFGAEF